MDNNILSCEYGINELQSLVDSGYAVDLNQGIDARLVNEFTAGILGRLKWIKYIRFSCDTLPQIEAIHRAAALRIQLIEADRVSTPQDKTQDPRIIGGVETNASGEVVAYHIKSTHPLSNEINTTGDKWDRVKAFGEKTGRRNVLHIMNRERIGQRRGVPFLAPVIEALKQLGRYTDAELIAAVVNGMFAVFIEKGENSGTRRQ